MQTSERLLPTITPVTLTLANTEYALTLDKVRQIAFQARTSVDIFFAFTPGQVAGGVAGVPTGNYATLKSGNAFSFPEKSFVHGVIYFACASAGVVVEAVEYT